MISLLTKLGIAVDSVGYVYVSDTVNHRIQKFSNTGTFITKWGGSGSGNGQMGHPHYVSVDSSGNVYVADYDNHRIQKFAQSSVVTYTPNPYFAGSDSFTFKANDGIQDSNIATISVMVLGSSQTVAGQATGQTTILGTCGLSFPNGNSVNYGSLVPNTISAEKKLNMTNSGSINAILTIKGGDWKDSGSNSVMLANGTHYNVTSSVAYAQKSPLQTFDSLVKNPFVPTVILQTFWQLQAILLNPSFTGTATQTMNFTVSC